MLLLAPAALASGLNRPNIFSPMAIGIGGAGFAGVPDPSTIHLNPAGLTLITRTVTMASVELVVITRAYVPADGGATEGVTAALPVPSVGFSTRLARKGGRDPLPIAFGLAFYNSYGGAGSYDPAQVRPGLIEGTLLVFEVVPAVAAEIAPNLSLGLGLRIGAGLFSIVNNESRGVERLPASVSGSGIGVGATLGASYSPTSWLRMGVVYGTPLRVNMKGEGDVQLGNISIRDNATVPVPWPQWAALGFAIQLTGSLALYTGVRWSDFSSLDSLKVELAQSPDISEPLRYSDGLSAHLGLRWQVHPRFHLMGGFSYDSNITPDRSMQRAFFDFPKFSTALGGSLVVGSFTIDLAYETVFGATREVPSEAANAYPGRYSQTAHSLGLGARYAY